jgi:type I restriction-modification system DNA methylase subunit
MARASRTAQLHADWIGMLQPEGLVASVAVLDELELYVRQPPEAQQRLRELTPDGQLPDLSTLLHDLLEWPRPAVVPPPDTLLHDLPDLRLTLRPTAVAIDRHQQVLALIQWADGPLDQAPAGDRWPADRTARFERLLLATGHPIGLIANTTHVRLVYAPTGEAPGHLTFPIAALHTTDGRLLVDALHLLLGKARLWTGPPEKRLHRVLKTSRERQEQVTNQLAEQVEDALGELLAGFDAADALTEGALLRYVTPEALYDGLSTALLRLVFVLYAEDRRLLPLEHPLYEAHYSVIGLADRLAREQIAHGEAMDRRYGAWAQLLVLFRMIWTGATHGQLHLPPRQGQLFHPDAHPFLEGRPPGSQHTTDPARLPPLADGVVHRVLQRLLHLDGQRISYRNLEVEQIGSVYEALMGYEVRRAASPALPMQGRAYVELAALAEAEHRTLFLAEQLGERTAGLRSKLPGLDAWEPTGDASADEAVLLRLLTPVRDNRRPVVRPPRHYLQPGQARRRSGSHYTPRSLTEPIVRRTLAPLLGEAPTPEQILDLKVCDPAMGSGAFLAEVCRQLGDHLVAAWARTGRLPADQHDPTLLARRKVAERCLYGVDKNPSAVQLARLSMWLITSAADLPFTFVDHALKPGDALIGLSLHQAAAFTFKPGTHDDAPLRTHLFTANLQAAARTRAQITSAAPGFVWDAAVHRQQRTLLNLAEDQVWDERRIADLIVANAWRDASVKEPRKAVTDRWKRMSALAWSWYPNHEHEPLPDDAEALLDVLPHRPFHWWLEFPEVFERKGRAGFDAVVGNPPFGGKNTLLAANGDGYIKLLQQQYPHAHGNSDLAAYFFLRAVDVLRKGGTFGLVASNTIAQGDTLDTGLRHLCNERGLTVFAALKDHPWPVKGAAVVVDVVNGIVGAPWTGACLHGTGQASAMIEVGSINSSLEVGEELVEPVALEENAGIAFQGSNVLGAGFFVAANEAERLLKELPTRCEVLRPFVSGMDQTTNVPAAAHEPPPTDKYVITFRHRSYAEAAEWPELLRMVDEGVREFRQSQKRARYRERWWQFAEERMELNSKLDSTEHCFAVSRVAKHWLLARHPTNRVFSHNTVVFLGLDWSAYAILQSLTHEHWARQLSSSLDVRLAYTPTRCFETFPFPRPTATQRALLATLGERLHTERAEVMVADRQGMTEVWNRLHDPHERDPAIHRLRATRDAMDRAVLDAYGWVEVEAEDAEGIVTRLRKLNGKRAREEERRRAEGG